MSDIDISALAEKRVALTVQDTDGSEKEIEGTIEAASAAGVVIRQKGARRSEVYAAAQILSAEVLLVGKKIKRRQLQPIEVEEAKQHLADRHGYSLPDVEPFTDEQALDFHGTINHENLAHYHRKPTPVEAAIAEAELEADEDE